MGYLRHKPFRVKSRRDIQRLVIGVSTGILVGYHFAGGNVSTFLEAVVIAGHVATTLSGIQIRSPDDEGRCEVED